MSVARENQTAASELPRIKAQRDRYRTLLFDIYRLYNYEREISPSLFAELEKAIKEPIE